MNDSNDGIEQIVSSEEEMRLLNDPTLFINRELSWIKLNERILEEAYDREHPLLERIKFLAICGSGLDELFMVRVSGLKRQALKGALKTPPDGMTPHEQLTAIRIEVEKLLKMYSKCWNEEIIIEYMLNIHLKDNVKARRLLSDGTYERIIPGPDDERINSQKWLIERRGIWHGDA